MGTWRIEPGFFGEQERWIPGFTGDWPADLDASNRSPSLGVIPPPCRECSGELTRRWVTPDAHAIAFRAARAVERRTRIIASGKDPGPLPPSESPTTVMLYDRACYRGRHGITRGSGASRGGSPQPIGGALELTPATRTDDWTQR